MSNYAKVMMFSLACVVVIILSLSDAYGNMKRRLVDNMPRIL